MKAKKLISAAMALVLVCGAPVVFYERPLNEIKTSALEYRTDTYEGLFSYHKYSDHVEVYMAVDATNLETIVIPSKIEGLPVTDINNSAFSRCKSLTSITLPESITIIGDSAFLGCISLTSITVPNSVVTIGERAFSGCTSLNSITISKNVTTIGGSAFSDCTGLTSITLPDSVTTIRDWVFKGCKGLKSITISDNATTIGYSMFYGCTGLTSVTIPESVTSVKDNAFVGCTNLTSLVIKNPKCELSATMTGYVLPFTIYGYANSTAQAYALSKGMEFKLLDNEPPTEEPTSAPSAGKADVNGDGKADASDASDILRYYAHLSTGGKLSFEEFIKK